MQDKLLQYFSNVSDPRSCRNQRHPFATLIGTSLLAALSGIDSFSGMQIFAEAHIDELENYFDFPFGAPSHDTFQRFWDALSPQEFIESFTLFTQEIEKIAADIISIDGKTIRNSGKENALHIVSAWCQANQLVLAQEKVNAKSNEITAIPQLLKLLDLRDRIVTIDAMGAQREICAQITGQLGDYVVCLKGNQGTLHDDVKQYLSDAKYHEEINENNDKGHGRIEQRTAVVNRSIRWLQQEHEWPGLKTIGKIESRVLKKGKESRETRYYISSLEMSARQLNDIARKHWGIENQLHWRLDVVFNEDKACIRNDNAAENMDILRKWSLNAVGQVKEKPSQSIKGIMRKNSMSFKYLISNVKKIFHA